ncbi:MAG: PAS domain-containing protein, partial [Alphaproteobacteria bacterium]|nr:PAS domain-containing protein [Alphaproteobacteria bacterium]
MRATSPAMPDAAETAWDRSPPVAASPLLQRAAAWWCGLDEAGGEGCRVAAETAKRALPADLRATVVLLDVVDDGADFRVVLVGDRVQRHGRAPLIGRSAQERFGPPGASAVFDDLAQAAQTGRPVAGAPHYVGPDASVGRAVHLMLPLRDAGGQVSQILVVIDFLEAPAEPTAPAAAARTGWEPGPLAAAAVLLAAFLVASLWLHGLLQTREADRLAGQRAYLAGSLEAALDGIEGAIADLAALVADQPAVTPER